MCAFCVNQIEDRFCVVINVEVSAIALMMQVINENNSRSSPDSWLFLDFLLAWTRIAPSDGHASRLDDAAL